MQLPKFLGFIFENENENCIDVTLTSNFITENIKWKNNEYLLVGGVCSSYNAHFTSFLYKYRFDYF